MSGDERRKMAMTISFEFTTLRDSNSFSPSKMKELPVFAPLHPARKIDKDGVQ